MRQTEHMYGEQRDKELLAKAQRMLSLSRQEWRVQRYARQVEQAGRSISHQSSLYLPRSTVSQPIQVHGQSKLTLI